MHSRQAGSPAFLRHGIFLLATSAKPLYAKILAAVGSTGRPGKPHPA
jgi:hypothetical protein